MEEAGEPGRREAEWQAPRSPEQRHRLAAIGDIRAHSRQELPILEGAAILPQRALVAGCTVDEVEDAARQPPPRQDPQLLDIRSPLDLMRSPNSRMACLTHHGAGTMCLVIGGGSRGW